MGWVRKGVWYICAALLCGLLGSGTAAAQTVEDVFWNTVKGCASAEEMELYLEQFPKGRHVGSAWECLERLRGPSVPPGTEFRDCPVCPEMVVVPAGSFMMGWSRHRVTIGYAFAVGKYEVKRGEFARFLKETGHSTGNACWTPPGAVEEELVDWNWVKAGSWRDPGFVQDDRHPVTCVTWHDATAYVHWLSTRTGKRYRLLSEAEWEYAATARTVTLARMGYTIGENMANCRDCGSQWDGKGTAPVGSFAPNGFGLHDMIGNVMEWVEDCRERDHDTAPSDGSAKTTVLDCSWRAIRGGSWKDYREPEDMLDGGLLVPWGESWTESHNSVATVGFRVALTPSH